jgi:tight adherence protein B
MANPLLVALGTFGLVLVLIVSAYFLFVVRVEAQEKATIHKRIRSASVARSVRLGVLREVERLSSIQALEQLLERSSVIVAPLQGLIARSGLQVKVGVLLLASGWLALLTIVIVGRVTGFLWIGLVAAPFAAYLPIMAIRIAAGRRMDKFEEQFPEAVDLIARTLRAGHAFTTGLKLAGDELPDPVGAEFRVLSDRQNFGLPIPEALRDFAERVPILDAKFFVTAVLTQRESGGNLAEVLDNLSAVIRERFRVKRQVRVITSHGRYTGLVLSFLPPVMAVVLLVRQPDSFMLLVTDPTGIRMIIFAVVLQVIGAVLIRKISNVEY